MIGKRWSKTNKNHWNERTDRFFMLLDAGLDLWGVLLFVIVESIEVPFAQDFEGGPGV